MPWCGDERVAHRRAQALKLLEALTAVTRPKTAVVVATFNGQRWVRDCLASVARQGPGVLGIVVDNASGDDTAAIVRQEFPDTQFIQNAQNLGFGAANNLGIRVALDAGAEFIFLLNQDAHLLDFTLEQLTRHLEAHPDVGVVAPLHCSPDADHIDRRTFRGYLQRHAEGYFCDLAVGQPQVSYRVSGVNAAGWLVRASVFRAFGGFDPLYFMYGEDDDLLARWAHHGVAFDLLPSVRMVHLRQSPDVPRRSLLSGIWLQSRRRRSDLLGAVKQPGASLGHMLAVLCAEGVIRPLAELLVRRDWRTFLATGLAMWRVLLRLPTVVAHCRISERPGPHFL